MVMKQEMLWHRLFHALFFPDFFLADLSSAEISANEAFYKSYGNRRLVTTAIDSVAMTTHVSCAMSCLIRNGCQAANFHDNMCQLTTAPSNESDWVDDVTANVIILDYDRCDEEPGFCPNGTICEPIWTTARCVCRAGFTGMNCDECETGYYGNSCNVYYELQQFKTCQVDSPLEPVSGSESRCAERCASKSNCGGYFVINSGNCALVSTSCESELKSTSSPSYNAYLKRT